MSNPYFWSFVILGIVWLPVVALTTVIAIIGTISLFIRTGEPFKSLWRLNKRILRDAFPKSTKEKEHHE